MAIARHSRFVENNSYVLSRWGKKSQGSSLWFRLISYMNEYNKRICSLCRAKVRVIDINFQRTLNGVLEEQLTYLTVTQEMTGAAPVCTANYCSLSIAANKDKDMEL